MYRARLQRPVACAQLPNISRHVMVPTLRPLLILHSNGAFRERLRRVGARGFHCAFVPDWSRLRQAVVNAPPAAIVIVDPYDGDGRALSGELRTLLWEFPS